MAHRVPALDLPAGGIYERAFVKGEPGRIRDVPSIGVGTAAATPNRPFLRSAPFTTAAL
jgi:hypothetical protein